MIECVITPSEAIGFENRGSLLQRLKEEGFKMKPLSCEPIGVITITRDHETGNVIYRQEQKDYQPKMMPGHEFVKPSFANIAVAG